MGSELCTGWHCGNLMMIGVSWSARRSRLDNNMVKFIAPPLLSTHIWSLYSLVLSGDDTIY